MKRHRRESRRAVADVKARFAEYVRSAEAGESTVITRHGRPVARLAPYRENGKESAGSLAGELRERELPYGAAGEEEFSSMDARRAALRRLLEEEIRPRVPRELRGKRVSRAEREEILGFGEDGL